MPANCWGVIPCFASSALLILTASFNLKNSLATAFTFPPLPAIAVSCNLISCDFWKRSDSLEGDTSLPLAFASFASLSLFVCSILRRESIIFISILVLVSKALASLTLALSKNLAAASKAFAEVAIPLVRRLITPSRSFLISPASLPSPPPAP